MAAGANVYKVQWRAPSAEQSATTEVESGSFGATNEAAANQAATTDTNHTITGLTENTLYYVQVIATRTGATDSAPSAEQSATTEGEPAAQPEGLTLSVVDSGALRAAWDTAARADGYKVQWRLESRSFGATNEAATADTTHDILNLAINITYYVRVIATRTGAPDSQPSASRSAQITFTPTGVTVSGITSMTATVSASLSNPDAVQATVTFRHRVNGSPDEWNTETSQTATTEASIVLTGLSPATTYEVQVSSDDFPSHQDTIFATLVTDYYIDPDPAIVVIRADNTWHAFKHNSGETLTVVVNAGQDSRYMAVSLSSLGSANCVQAINDRVSVPPKETVYVTGCAAGPSAIQLQNAAGVPLATYNVTVLVPELETVEAEDPAFAWRQQGVMHLPGEGLRLEMLNTLAGTYDDYAGYSYEARLEQPEAPGGRVDILADMTRDGSEPSCVLGVGRVIDVSMVTTTVAGYTGPVNAGGLASDGSTLYMVDTGADKLYTLNTATAVATEVGSLGSSVQTPSGLAFHDSTLYVVDSGAGNLYTVNTSTGAATLVGSLGSSVTSPSGLASDGSALYMVDSDTDNLYTVRHEHGRSNAGWVSGVYCDLPKRFGLRWLDSLPG